MAITTGVLMATHGGPDGHHNGPLIETLMGVLMGTPIGVLMAKPMDS